MRHLGDAGATPLAPHVEHEDLALGVGDGPRHTLERRTAHGQGGRALFRRHPLDRAVPRDEPLAVAGLGLCRNGVGVAPEGRDAQAKRCHCDGKGFVSGDGTIERVTPEQRSTPLTVSGTTLQGVTWTVADAKGKVLVLNVWGQWCGPCVAEMPHLQQVWSQVSASGEPVQFMGINYRDGADTAR